MEGSASIRALVVLLVLGSIVVAASQLIAQYFQLQDRRIGDLEEQLFLLKVGARVAELAGQDGFVASVAWEIGEPKSGEVAISGIEIPARMAERLGVPAEGQLAFSDPQALVNLNAVPESWLTSAWLGSLLAPGVSFREFDEFRRENSYPETLADWEHLISERWAEFVTTAGLADPAFADVAYLRFVAEQRGATTSPTEATIPPYIDEVPVVSLLHTPDELLAGILRIELQRANLPLAEIAVTEILRIRRTLTPTSTGVESTISRLFRSGAFAELKERESARYASLVTSLVSSRMNLLEAQVSLEMQTAASSDPEGPNQKLVVNVLLYEGSVVRISRSAVQNPARP